MFDIIIPYDGSTYTAYVCIYRLYKSYRPGNGAQDLLSRATIVPFQRVDIFTGFSRSSTLWLKRWIFGMGIVANAASQAALTNLTDLLENLTSEVPKTAFWKWMTGWFLTARVAVCKSIWILDILDNLWHYDTAILFVQLCMWKHMHTLVQLQIFIRAIP